MGEHGMIEVSTCMDGTKQSCCLSKGETGTQRAEIINWRSHITTVKVKIQSLNKNILLMHSAGSGGSYKYVEEAHIAPSIGTSTYEHQLQVPAKRDLQGTSASEIIQVSMSISTEQAAEDCREGPTLNSKVQFK